jgi:hypothetical protein
MLGQPEPCVVIAGDGVAASALACLLRDNGFGVILAARRRKPMPGNVIEALPQAAVQLINEIGLTRALGESAPLTVDGFDNLRAPHRLTGTWTHVDRVRLAERCFTQARRRGATVVHHGVTDPPLDCGDGVRIQLGPYDIQAFAAVDGTGRAARWSRPVQQAAPAMATLYAGCGSGAPRAGRLTGDGDRWAYLLEHHNACTLGVITPRGVSSTHQIDDLAAALNVHLPIDPRPTARCGASVQWATEAVGHRRLAVGDAALAMSPLAGQGVRFALSSALAAAAVLRTWADGHNDIATDYYRSFVGGVRNRHRAKMRRLQQDPLFAQTPDIDLPKGDPALIFTASALRCGQNRGGRIVAAECFQLPDGGLVRTVAGVELQWLREATAKKATVTELNEILTRRGVSKHSAAAVIEWAFRHEVLAIPAL